MHSVELVPSLLHAPPEQGPTLPFQRIASSEKCLSTTGTQEALENQPHLICKPLGS